MTGMIEKVARAMRECVIVDDEGQFPRLFDMLDFSGENKAHTVVDALAIAAIKAMREPADEMLMAGMCAKITHPEHDNSLSRHERLTAGIYTAMIDAALGEHA